MNITIISLVSFFHLDPHFIFKSFYTLAIIKKLKLAGGSYYMQLSNVHVGYSFTGPST